MLLRESKRSRPEPNWGLFWETCVEVDPEKDSESRPHIENVVSLRAPLWQARGPHETIENTVSLRAPFVASSRAPRNEANEEKKLKKGVPLKPARRRVCTINQRPKDERKRKRRARCGTARCGGTVLVAFKGCVP